MAAPAESAPLAADEELPLRPDVFLSYSRSDEEFVRRLAAALEARGKAVWVDLSDIRKGADWHAKMLAGVESARVVVPVLDPDFAASEPCAEEIEHAVGHNKRLVPIVRHPVERGSVRAELTTPNWIFFDDDERFEEAVDELVEAAEADFDWLEEHARVLARALEWKRADAHAKPSLLLRGGDLDAAEDWLAAQGEHRERATPVQIDYIVASRRAATRRHRMTIGAVSLALAVSVGLTIFALIQRSQAIHQSNLAGSRELAVASTAALGDDPELSLLLAQRAAEKAPTPEATAALRAALDESRVRMTVRPGGPVVSAVYSSEGRRLLTASKNSAVRLWPADDGRSTVTLHTAGKVQDAEFRPDGREVVTSSLASSTGPGTLEVWDLRDGQRVGTLVRLDDGASATYSTDGRFILTFGVLSPAVLWRFDGAWHLVHTFGGRRLVASSAELSADGSRVLTSVTDLVASVKRLTSNAAQDATPAGSSAAFVRVWSARTGEALVDFRGGDALGNARFSPDGRFVVTTGFGIARIWNAATGRRVRDLVGHRGAVNDARFSADGRLVITASDDGTARLWDARTGRQLLVLRGHTAPVETASFSADGRHVLTAGADGTARIWDVSGVLAPPTRGASSPDTIALSADAGVMAATGPKGVTVWGVHPRHRIGRIDLVSRASQPAEVVVSPDGRYVLALSSTQEVTLWDVRRRRSIAHLGRAWTLDPYPFSADGTRVEVLTKEGLGVWDVRAGRYVLRKREPANGDFIAATLSPDGRTAVTGGFGSAWAWNIRTGNGRRLFSPGGEAGPVRFSPDGSRLAVGTGKGAFLWDVTHNRHIATLHGHTQTISSLSFSPDGSRILTVAGDETARLWDGHTGTPIAVIRRNTEAVTSAEFSPDGRFIATAGGDDAIRIADGQTGAPITIIRTGRGNVFTAAFIGDTTDLVATGAGGAPWVVQCDLCAPVDDLLALSRRRVTRDLTPAERKKYLHA